ncbi:hypothetical protein BHM03_00006507 [Ensete ventricosum]|nr:hypothetical protein BHM03_00006507 [Ensete ventricosum]
MGPSRGRGGVGGARWSLTSCLSSLWSLRSCVSPLFGGFPCFPFLRCRPRAQNRPTTGPNAHQPHNPPTTNGEKVTAHAPPPSLSPCVRVATGDATEALESIEPPVPDTTPRFLRVDALPSRLLPLLLGVIA